MTSNASALRALLALTQLEIVKAGLNVAEASARTAQEQRFVRSLSQRCDAVLQELRRAVSGHRIDPAITESLRRQYQSDRRSLRDSNAQLRAARTSEQLARDVLAGLRNRERLMREASQAQRRANEANQLKRESDRMDDLWVQYAWRFPP